MSCSNAVGEGRARRSGEAAEGANKRSLLGVPLNRNVGQHVSHHHPHDHGAYSREMKAHYLGR